MKVLGRGKVIEIQIAGRQFEDRSGIGQDVAPAIALQNNCQPGLGRSSYTTNFGNVHAAGGQSIKSDLTQLIIPNTRNESNPVSQSGEIVRHNRRTSCRA